MLVTAGERVDLLVTPTGEPGSSIVVKAMLYNRGYGSVEYRSVEDVLTIEFRRPSGEVVKSTLTLAEDPALQAAMVEATGGTLTAEQKTFREAWVGSKVK